MIPGSRPGEKALGTLTTRVWVRPRSDLYSLGVEKNLSLSERMKGIRIQFWTDSLGSRRLRLPEVPNNLYMKVVMLSTLHTRRLYRPEIPLALLSTPGWQWGRKDYVNEKFQLESNSRPSGL